MKKYAHFLRPVIIAGLYFAATIHVSGSGRYWPLALSVLTVMLYLEWKRK